MGEDQLLSPDFPPPKILKCLHSNSKINMQAKNRGGYVYDISYLSISFFDSICEGAIGY